LELLYYAVSAGADGNPTSWVPGTGFTLLDADIAWNTNQGFPHASQYFIQAATAPINPGITASGTTNGFNAVAVALRAASTGVAAPSGIHINKIIHRTTNAPPSTWTLQFPTSGNLRVLATANGSNLTNITAINDSDGGVWTKIELGGDEPQIWYSANTTANPNLSVTLRISGASPTITVLFYDIAGASATPLDVVAGVPSIDVSNQSTVNNMPSITPTTTNGVVIAVMGLGQGPGLGLGSGAPTNAVFDLVTYTGETDLDLMENADAQAHYYYSSSGTVNWNIGSLRPIPITAPSPRPQHLSPHFPNMIAGPGCAGALSWASLYELPAGAGHDASVPASRSPRGSSGGNTPAADFFSSVKS
jgi:hypothetical protein